MHNGNLSETQLDESSRVEPKSQERSQHAQETSEDKPRTACPFTESKTWHGLPGALEVVYVQVKQPLDWEALALITRDSGGGLLNSDTGGEPGAQMTECPQTPQGLPPRERPRGTMPCTTTMKVILGQGPWCNEELTMAWEKCMQTEGLSQHVCCQHCDSTEKPIVVVTPEWSNDDNWCAFAQPAGTSPVGTTANKSLWISLSSSNTTPPRADFSDSCPMQKKNIREGFGDRSLTTN